MRVANMVLSALYSIFILAGIEYLYDGGVLPPGSEPAGILSRIAVFVVCAVLFYAVLSLPARMAGIGRPRMWNDAAARLAAVSPRTKCIALFCAFLLVWSPWLILTFPGPIAQDTTLMLAESQGLAAASNHDPYIDTLLFGAFYDLGETVLGAPWRGVFLYCALQMVVFAALSTGVMRYLSRVGMGYGAILALCVAMAVLPIYPIGACFMSKDSLFTLAWVPYLIMYIEIVRTKGDLLRRPSMLAAFIVLSIFVGVAKKTGLYIEVLSVIPLLLYCAGNRLRITASLATGLVCVALVYPLALGALGVAPGASRVVYSIPLQQMGRVCAECPDDIDADDRERLDRYFAGADIGEKYRPTYADPLTDSLDSQAFADDTAGFFRLWIDLGIDHPGVYLAALVNHDVYFLFPAQPSDNGLDPGNLFASDEHFLTNYHRFAFTHGTEWVDGFDDADHRAFIGQFVCRSESGAAIADDIRTFIDERTPLGVLSGAAIVPTWILLYLFVTAFALPAAQRNRRIVLLMPWIWCLASLLVGPTTAMRYFIPLFYAAPLLLAVPLLSRVGDGSDVRSNDAPKPSADDGTEHETTFA